MTETRRGFDKLLRIASRGLSTLPVGMAVAMKILSFQTTGDEVPLPGMGIFQAMLTPSLQFRGGFALGLYPVARGPRHWGHASVAGVSAFKGMRCVSNNKVNSHCGFINSLISWKQKTFAF